VLAQEEHLIAARYAIQQAHHELALANLGPSNVATIRALHRLLDSVLDLLEPYIVQSNSKHV